VRIDKKISNTEMPGQGALNVTVLFSGGKDSCLATWYALHQGWNVTSLLVIQPRSPDSWMFHFPAVRWARLQGEAIGIPSIIVPSSSEKGMELDTLKRSLAELKSRHRLHGVVSGAVASDYQKKRIDSMCEEIGLASLAPLWHKDPELLLDDTIDLGFETYFVGVSALGLDEGWLGKTLNKDSLSELKKLSKKYGIHLSGEGGEYETFVTDAGFFRASIKLKKISKHWEGSSGFLIIHEAELTSKA